MEDIYTFLQSALRRKKRQDNLTDEQLAKIAGCKQSKMNAMLNDIEYFKKVEFRTLVNLFPDFFKALIQGNAIASGNGSAASVNGNAITSATIDMSKTGQVLEELENSVLEDDKVCDKCKVRVMKLIKSKRV